MRAAPGGRSSTATPSRTAKLKPGDVFELGETQIRFGSGTETLPPGAAKTPRPDGQRDNPLDKLVGTTLVRYTVGSPIDSGRSGVVFRAVDTKYDRPVALKVLWPELTQDEREVDRFIRAIKTMLPVQHENIVRLYGAGVTDGYCWMAMELVEGESLADVIKRMGVGGMLEWEPVLRAAVDITQALEVAEQHKIVHRNITPSNILIRSKDSVAKLADLMLAKAIEGPMAQSITRSGEIVGELPYMSPEQTTGIRRDRLPQRHLQPGSDVLSAAHRAHAGRRQKRRRHDPQNPERSAAQADEVPTLDPAALRGDRDEDAGKEPRRPLRQPDAAAQRTQTRRQVPGVGERISLPAMHYSFGSVLGFRASSISKSESGSAALKSM